LQYGTTSYSNHFWTGVPDYSQRNSHAIHLSGEWLPDFDPSYGKMGVGFGIGTVLRMNVPLGNGETLDLFSYPLHTFVTYRADFFHNQILVPFVKVGTELTFFRRVENRDLADSIHTYFGYNFGGGIEFCLDVIDPSTSEMFDNSMGVNSTYFIFEYLAPCSDGCNNNKTDDSENHEHTEQYKLKFTHFFHKKKEL